MKETDLYTISICTFNAGKFTCKLLLHRDNSHWKIPLKKKKKKRNVCLSKIHVNIFSQEFQFFNSYPACGKIECGCQVLEYMSCRAANISILQSERFSSVITKIFYITYNLMDKKFPESGRLSNLCTRIDLFSLKITKSFAESGRVGSPGVATY